MRSVPPRLLGLGIVLTLAIAAQAFTVSIREVRSRESGLYTRADVESNGEKFSFAVPRGWRASRGVQANSISLNARSRETPIVIRFSTDDAEVVLASTEAMRQAVVPFLKNTTVLEEFPTYSAYGPGRAIDLAFVFFGSAMKARIAVVPLSEGYASFFLSCQPEDWTTAEQNFGNLVTSFRRITKQTQEDIVQDDDPRERERWRQRRAAAQIAADPPAPLRPEMLIPLGGLDDPETSIFDGRGDYVLLGLAFLLVATLTACTLVRHRREAEIRLLTGTYLTDGIEAASFKMPSLFATPFSDSNGELVSEEDKKGKQATEVSAADALLAPFFTFAAEQLMEIRKLLPELGRTADEAERRATLLKLHELILAVKAKANCWHLRPVWQLTSALDYLVKRLADKCKDATPSSIRTVASAVDLLADLCVPGVRPDLIINPPIAVMAVDDDPLCLRAVMFALQKAEMTPDIAETGEKAVELAEEKFYDVIFMDIKMPGIDGIEACTQIKKGAKNKNTPVVFVTVQSDFHTRAQSTLAGGTDLMAKPFLMFEITVKALTFSMRKRLELAASLRREMSTLTSAAQIEAAAVSSPATIERDEVKQPPVPAPSASAPSQPVKEAAVSLPAITILPPRESALESRRRRKSAKRSKHTDKRAKVFMD